MEKQTVGCSERTQYFIDNANEGGEIDSGSALCLLLYGDRAVLDGIVDCFPNGGAWRRRQDICWDLLDYADTLLPQIKVERRAALIRAGITSINHYITQLAEVLGDWAISDTVEGGSLLPFRRGRNIRSKDGPGGPPTKKWAGKLRAPGWIRRYTRNDETANYLRRLAARTLARMSMIPAGFSVDISTAEMMAEITTQAPGPRDPRADEPLFAPGYDMSADITPEQYEEIIVRWRPKARKAIRRRTRERQRMLKRASVLAVNVIGPEATSAMARHQPVRFDGQDIALLVQCQTSLGTLGHGAMTVAVITPAGVLLANLCVYFDDTPVIDQFIAFALYMQAGLEREIIDKANLTMVSADGVGHPILAGKHRRALEAGQPPQIDDGMPVPISRYDRVRRRNVAYYAETRDLWETTLGVFVLGRKFKPIRRGHGREQ